MKRRPGLFHETCLEVGWLKDGLWHAEPVERRPDEGRVARGLQALGGSPRRPRRAAGSMNEQQALVPVFGGAEARRLTDQVKRDAQALWRKLIELYEGGAHTALNYTNWHEYCKAEFGFGRSHS